MKVFRVTDVSGSGTTRQKHASLGPPSDRIIGRDLNEFEGKPYSKAWRPYKVYLDKPRLPRPDFFAFDSKVLVCNERAVELVGEPMAMAGELLPIKVEGEKTTLYLLNITECINVVNPKKSQWRDVGGKYKTLETPAFRRDRFGEHTSLFKIPDDYGLRIHCLERSGDPYDGEFKALVEEHGLTGLEFELIWTDRKTTARKRRKPVRSVNPPLERTATAVHSTGGRASRVRRRGR